ncbi:hypothetical protein D3C87_411420 [compost metagenome]
MKRKLLLCLGLVLSAGLSKAQWVNETTVWNYGFSSGTSGTFSTGASNAENISTSGSPFLPSTPSGTSRVGLIANTTGTFVLNATNNTLAITGSSAGASKFSAYNITGASEIASISFEVTFSNPNSQAPTYYFSMGTKAAAGNLYNNNNAVFTGANSGGALFNAIRFLYSAANVTLGHRSSGDSNGNYVTLSGGNLAFETPYRFELYMNNSSSTAKSYTRGSTTYTVPAKNYHLWVTNVSTGTSVRYTYLSSPDLPRPIETNTSNSTDATIPENSPLNSFLFQSINIANNASSLKIAGGINVAYNETTLPVNFITFTGKKSANGIALNWSTASEQNNSHFDILRSSDGKTYTSIGTVTGKGNSSERSQYSLTDTRPFAGMNYYILKQVDFDGTVAEFEDKVAINYKLGLQNSFTVNAKENVLNVSVDVENATVADFYIYDTNGRKLTATKLKLNSGSHTYTVDATNLVKGILIARIVTTGGTQSVKFLR